MVAKYGMSLVGQLDPLKREQLPIVATLDRRSNSGDIRTFSRSYGTELDPSTSYFVVLDSERSSGGSVSNTSSNAQTSSYGWTIANGSISRNKNNSGGWSNYGSSKRIRIVGTETAICPPGNAQEAQVGHNINTGGGGSKWFQTLLTAGSNYRFDTYHTIASVASIPKICGPDRKPIAGAGSTGAPYAQGTRYDWTPKVTGMHYVNVKPTGGTLFYRVSDLSADYCSAKKDTMCSVAVDGSFDAMIVEFSDKDWISADLDANTRYRFTVHGTSDSGARLESPRIRGIYDSDGRKIQRPDEDGTVPAFTGKTPNLPSDTGFYHNGWQGRAVVEYTPKTTGAHYISVSSMGSLNIRGGKYVIKLDELSAVDPAYDDFAGAGPSGTPDQTTGTITVDGVWVRGIINPAPLWYDAGDHCVHSVCSSADSEQHAGNRYPERSGYKECHDDQNDGRTLDRDTCDVDWFEMPFVNGQTYRITVDGQKLKGAHITGIYDNSGALIANTTAELGANGADSVLEYTVTDHFHKYIGVTSTDNCSGVFGCIGGYKLKVELLD